MTKPTAYSYIRFSSLTQLEGRSQSRQSEACAKFCAANDLALAQGEDYTFLDAGKSGYKAEHLDVNGQLRRFLSLVENGTITPGSFLIVESLDRLSREHVKTALPRFMDLLDKGINIATLLDGKIYTSDYTELDLIISILIMTRAHEESTTKAKRVGDAWRTKKEKARSENAPIGNNAPLWLTYSNGAYAIDTARAIIVRRIFDLAINGHGKTLILKALNTESIPSFKGKTWGTSSLQKILANRALLGEYQPFTGRGKDRQPSGSPIVGYFPAVITEATFYEAQAATALRKVSKATKQPRNFNVWQGVAICLDCLSPLHMVNKGKPPKGGIYLHCSNSRKGLCDARAMRLAQTEIVFKEILAKVDSLSLVQDSAASLSKQISVLDGKLSVENLRLTEYKSALKNRYTVTFDDLVYECEQVVSELTTKKEALLTNLASESITDKEHFFSKLDLVSYEGRYRANALLKILKIQVAIQPDSKSTMYILSKGKEKVLGISHYNNGEIGFLAFSAGILDKMKAQDFDGSMNSTVDMLMSERMSDRLLNGEWWDDATYDIKLLEMFKRVDMSLTINSEQFQDLKARLDIAPIMASPKMQERMARVKDKLALLE